MASYTLFPGIVPSDDNDEGEIPRYRELDWNSLRAFTNGIGVNGKQKRPGVIWELDEEYGVNSLAEYAELAYGLTEEEYREEFDPRVTTKNELDLDDFEGDIPTQEELKEAL